MEEEFRCSGCGHVLNPADFKGEGLKIRYILTDFEHHEIKHFCSKECL